MAPSASRPAAGPKAPRPRAAGSAPKAGAPARPAAVAELGPIAGLGPRTLAFLVDAVAANLLVGLAYIGGWSPGSWRGLLVLGAFLLIELVFVAATGQTPGMRVAGIAVVRFRDGGRPAWGWTLARTLLLATILPALVIDRSGRALHDRAAGTVMLTLR